MEGSALSWGGETEERVLTFSEAMQNRGGGRDGSPSARKNISGGWLQKTGPQ